MVPDYINNVTVAPAWHQALPLRDSLPCPWCPVMPPEVTVFPRGPVELGEPNILICFADKFSPPTLSVTWLKNGQEVTKGVYETDFYPRPDNSFRKFSYLPFLPSQGDFYDCRVEHGGLAETFTKHW
uniref:Ig-like domain-containing protein n=1 Tax=Chrysemys picta bellii TaxID=8478 RepID=A0A8C3F377_CHRPI